MMQMDNKNILKEMLILWPLQQAHSHPIAVKTTTTETKQEQQQQWTSVVSHHFAWLIASEINLIFRLKVFIFSKIVFSILHYTKCSGIVCDPYKIIWFLAMHEFFFYTCDKK